MSCGKLGGCTAYVFSGKDSVDRDGPGWDIYRTYLPHMEEDKQVEEDNFLQKCTYSTMSLIWLETVVCKPKIGEKITFSEIVKSPYYEEKNVFRLEELNSLTPLGKFTYKPHRGRTWTMLALDKEEQSLPVPQLIKNARMAYLQYEKTMSKKKHESKYKDWNSSESDEEFQEVASEEVNNPSNGISGWCIIA